jgi:hypothetical protein
MEIRSKNDDSESGHIPAPLIMLQYYNFGFCWQFATTIAEDPSPRNTF